MVANHYRNTKWRIRSSARHRDWILKVIGLEGKDCGTIDFIFADDDTVRNINIEFLNHSYHTDVITFDNSSSDIVSGEVYIGTGTVKANAREYGVSFADEIRRVMVHSVLHMCGYDDHCEDGAAEMRKMEDKYLQLFRDEFQI